MCSEWLESRLEARSSEWARTVVCLDVLYVAENLNGIDTQDGGEW
jgi:hypothetical protein